MQKRLLLSIILISLLILSGCSNPRDISRADSSTANSMSSHSSAFLSDSSTTTSHISEGDASLNVSEPTAPELSSHTHIFTTATCVSPKICSICNETEGDTAEHNWNPAMCTTPKTCSVCNKTDGKATGHNWKSATCTTPKTCYVCGKTEGSATGHSYQSGSCSSCGANDPTDPLVWIPTNGGTKHHKTANCSKMIDPILVPKSEALSRGFGSCGKCY